jgi:endo-alpha-1,4-polygalactosaminidase (GH114 family)
MGKLKLIDFGSLTVKKDRKRTKTVFTQQIQDHKYRGAFMDTSDWAKNLVERKKKELVKDDKLDAQLETKWIEVCQAAQKAVAEVNKQMGQEYIRFSQDPNADKFSLIVGEADNVVRLDRANRAIRGSRDKTYRLTLVGDTPVWKYDPVDYTSEQIARDEVQQTFED